MTLDSRAIARLTAILFTVFLVQISVVPHFRIGGYIIDLPLIAVLLVCLRLSPPNGALAGFAVGITIDLAVHTPFGMTALTFALAGYGAGAISAQLVERNLLTRAFAAALLGATATAVFACIGALIGLEYVTRRELGAIALVTAVASLPITVLVDPLVQWAFPLPSVQINE
ncbi:MAG: rod shape-determining protein MreD [Acidimicrobiales bacterium]|nr:rod shape-determining protein MreD [Acidimicrobiales bacterium]